MRLSNILILATSASMFFAACQKEFRSGVYEEAAALTQGKRVELSINEEVKSSYVPGSGVSIDGTEALAVFYSDPETKLLGESIKASPIGGGKYSFTIPAGVSYEDMFYAVLPWSATTAATQLQRTVKARIFSVQYPLDASFDPQYDILAAEGFKIEEETATINRFRRMTAPLRVAVKGLPAGSKIHTASISFSQNPNEQACKGLVGGADLYMTDNYRKSAMTSLSEAGFGVSAVYEDGLGASGDVWNVWFSVNPAELGAGSEMKIVISTADRTFSKTAVLPFDGSIKRNELNEIKVDMTSAESEESVTINLADEDLISTLSSGTVYAATGTDGKTYQLTFSKTGCSVNGFDGMRGGINITAADGTGRFLTLPKPEGKDITAVRMFTRPTSTNGAERDLRVCAYKKENEISSDSFNAFCNENSGYCELSIPSVGATTLGGTQLRTSDGTFSCSAITFALRDKVVPVYDPNDYSSIWNAGLDFTIGDLTINIDDYPNAKIVSLKDLAASDFTYNGILFIDPDGEEFKALSGKVNPGTNTIVVGRFINSQPEIHFDNYIQPKSNSFKNVRIVSSATGTFTPNNGTGGVCSVTLEDCTVISTGGTLLREAVGTAKFGTVRILNSIVQVKTGIIGNASGASAIIGTEDKFDFENSVFMPLPSDGAIKNFATNVLTMTANESHAQIVFKGNTFVGFNGPSGGTALVNLKSIGGFEIDRNVFVGEWPAGKTDRILKTTAKQSFQPTPRIITANFAPKSSAGTVLGETNGDSQCFWNNQEKGGSKLSYTTKDNKFDYVGSPFLSEDYTNAYFPVNTTVVTNGAGATYETKLWKQWNAE